MVRGSVYLADCAAQRSLIRGGLDEYGGARDESFSFWRRSSEIRMAAWKSTAVAGMRASSGEGVVRSVWWGWVVEEVE